MNITTRRIQSWFGYWVFGGILPFLGYVKLYCMWDEEKDMISFPETEEQHDECTHYYNALVIEWLWRGTGICAGKPRRVPVKPPEESPS